MDKLSSTLPQSRSVPQWLPVKKAIGIRIAEPIVVHITNLASPIVREEIRKKSCHGPYCNKDTQEPEWPDGVLPFGPEND